MLPREIRSASRATLTRKPSGVALLVLLGLLGLVAALFVAGFAGNLIRSNATDQRTANALAQAKEALIGYAANYPDEHSGRVFGYLPCPDTNGSGTGGEGTAVGTCGGTDVTVIGRLPWKTLELPPLRDGDGECLWYAVSGSFKNNPSTDLMSWDTNGLITVMAPDSSNFVAGGSGSTAIPTRRAAAVIFAAGAILPSQDRSLAATNPPANCGGNYNAANYLDTDTASAINNATAPSATTNALSKFIAALNSNRTGGATNTFNDRLAFITADDIFANRAQKRSDFLPNLTDPNTGMLRKLADCIVWFGQKNPLPLGLADKRLPWAAPLTNNNYGDSTNYNDATGQYSGRLPYILDDTQAATLNLLLLGTPLPANQNLSNFCPNWNTYNEFWTNWKDHVFYAVAKAFAPNNSAVASLPNPCAADECITVDSATDVAAVVIFAGEKVSGQNRNNDANPAYTSSDKSAVTNYLEGVNATAIQQNTPNIASPRVFSKTPAGGNDTVMCIRTDVVTGLLYVDPTCAATSACSTDARAPSGLAGYRSGNVNNCNAGSNKVVPACQTLADRIGANNCSCKKAAKDFISKKCLGGFTDPKCQAAYTTLTTC